MTRATLSEPYPLHAQLGTASTSLFVQAKVYDISGNLVSTVSPVHIDSGLYGVSYTFNTEGYYTVVYNVYTDSGFTTLSTYTPVAESVEVNSDKTNIVKLLGLTHDNVVIDSQVYDVGTGNLTSSRVRHYSNSANANVASGVGLLNTWNISATYNGSGQLTQYKMIKL